MGICTICGLEVNVDTHRTVDFRKELPIEAPGSVVSNIVVSVKRKICCG